MDKDGGKAVGMVKRQAQKVWYFLINGFWKNIGCIVSDPKFCLGRSRLWEEEEAHKISGNKRKRCSTRVKVNFYEVCLSYIIYCLLFYIITILNPFFPARFVASITPGEKISRSIGHKYLR